MTATYTVEVELRMQLAVREDGINSPAEAEREVRRRLAAGEAPNLDAFLVVADWSLVRVVPGSGREATIAERSIAEEFAP